MSYIDLTVVSSKCDLEMTKIEVGSSAWDILMAKLSKTMSDIPDILTELTYDEHRAIAKMPDSWHRETTINRVVSGPDTEEKAQFILRNIYNFYGAYVKTRTRYLLEQEHISTMRWLITVLSLAGEKNLADVLDSFFTYMKYNVE